MREGISGLPRVANIYTASSRCEISVIGPAIGYSLGHMIPDKVHDRCVAFFADVAQDPIPFKQCVNAVPNTAGEIALAPYDSDVLVCRHRNYIQRKQE